MDWIVWGALAAGVAFIGLAVWVVRALSWFDPDDPRW